MLANESRFLLTIVFEEAPHTYFAISDVSDITISGLAGITYIDKTDAARRKPQTTELVTITAETDRAYLDTPGQCVIEDRGWRRRVVIEKSGAVATLVWNPWATTRRWRKMPLPANRGSPATARESHPTTTARHPAPRPWHRPQSPPASQATAYSSQMDNSYIARSRIRFSGVEKSIIPDEQKWEGRLKRGPVLFRQHKVIKFNAIQVHLLPQFIY